MLITSFLLILLAPAGAATPVDAGRVMPAGSPVVLVVSTPGIAASAEQGLVDALEAEGLDAWLLDLPPAEQDLDDPAVLLAAREALPSPAHALVGHGLGGTLAARSSLEQAPTALATLGSPLAQPSSALASWLCQQEIPADGLDLARQTGASWHDQPVLELLLGSPLPALDRVAGGWLGDLCAWSEPVDLRQVGFPVWAGVGDLDELGPPEKIRPWLPPQAEFHRFGLLRLDTKPYRSVDLLSREPPARLLASWLAQALRKQ